MRGRPVLTKIKRGLVMAEPISRHNRYQSCVNCQFWEHKGATFGLCKRHPPKEASEWATWPDRFYRPGVDYDDWCGEFRPCMTNEDGKSRRELFNDYLSSLNA